MKIIETLAIWAVVAMLLVGILIFYSAVVVLDSDGYWTPAQR